MIDFKNATFAKLDYSPKDIYMSMIGPILVPGEEIVKAFSGIRDGVIFTNKRIIAVNVQGISGKKKDFTSLPYSRIQAFSTETAGTLDTDCELELWFSGLGAVKFEFAKRIDITALCKMIGEYVL